MQEFCLAPLRFGAGLKGKFIDAIKNGTPAVTTKIGAEGISGDLSFSGVISDDVNDIINESISLYTNKGTWLEAQQKGIAIINHRFNRELYCERLRNLLDKFIKK